MVKSIKRRIKNVAYRTLVTAGTLLHNPHGLKIAWFDRWQPVLDDALRDIPESATCPHELFRLLVRNPCAVPKRTALVTRAGTPVAVVGLRRVSHTDWELVTQWMVPGFLFPVMPGLTMPVLETLGVELSIIWWRMNTLPPPSNLIQKSTTIPGYRMPCASDFEVFWRKTGNFKTVANARNHCRDFTVAINTPGIIEWTLENWERKWRVNPKDSNPFLSDQITAARFLQDHKLSCTLALLDNGSPVAASMNFVQGTSLVGGILYRKPEYDRQKVGIRMIDIMFSYAKTTGFDEFDLGEGLEGTYKAKWAPKQGERVAFQICPKLLSDARRLFERLRPAQPAVDSSKIEGPKEID